MSFINKFVIGLAQSDPKYGLNKNNKFDEVFDQLKNYNLNFFDTAESYKNSHHFISRVKDKYNAKIISKISFEDLNDKNLKKKVNEKIKNILVKNSIKKIYAILIHDPVLPLYQKKWEIIHKELKKFKKKGFSNKIGISVYNRYELDNVLKIFTPDIVQFPLNVFDQSFNDKSYLKSLKQKKIELHARSIFLQGTLLKNMNNHKYFKKWKNYFSNWESFLRVNKLNKLDGCLKFILQNKLIDKIVIGLGQKSHLSSLIEELKKIDIKKKYDFSSIEINDSLLKDPRFWTLNSNNTKKYYSYWLNVKDKLLNGSNLLSKRPNQFIPVSWPTFYKKAKSCFIWDNYDKKYLDFSLMGIGTNILGYSNNKVNSFVKKAIDSGNVSTLNSNYDFILSKKLLEMHPWSGMATYSRTGAEANAIAIRISRAYTGKDEIAICGYHGWHDWYLSANLKNSKNLNDIHLEGLSTIGIPKKLKGITHPFKYNDLKSFNKIIKKNKNIGTVFMEVERNEKPKNNFLKKIREITKKNNIILIFDECSSGFRETYGGLHKKYNIEPDLAVFGKSLGNGIPITAVIGKKKIMEKSINSFISSTFWSDATGPAAAIATLNEMKKIKSWKKITNTGYKIKKYWKYLSKKYKIKIVIFGIDAMPSFKFDHKLNLYLRTFMIQEFLKKGILVSNTVYCCTDHEKYLNVYFRELDLIFKKIKHLINRNNIAQKIEAPISIPGFSRLN